MTEDLLSYNQLTGGQKAAILMLCLKQEHSTILFNLMDDEEISDLSLAMAKLGQIDEELIEQLFDEFTLHMSGSGTIMGGAAATERLLARGFDPEKAAQIMEEIRGPAGRTMWDKLANVNEEVLANYLKNEYPQTVAVVLSKLKPNFASRVLSVLPDKFATEVIMRLLTMGTVQREVIEGVEKTLRNEFMTSVVAGSGRPDSHEVMADIFNNLDRNTEERFMTALEERNSESAEKIKGLMFTFEDLKNIDPSGIQVLLRQVDKDQLAIALKGASEEIKGLFFNNMSERAGKMMLEDMDAMGPLRLKDVTEAQSTIVTAARTLADEGEIAIAGSGGEDELIF